RALRSRVLPSLVGRWPSSPRASTRFPGGDQSFAKRGESYRSAGDRPKRGAVAPAPLPPLVPLQIGPMHSDQRPARPANAGEHGRQFGASLGVPATRRPSQARRRIDIEVAADEIPHYRGPVRVAASAPNALRDLDAARALAPIRGGRPRVVAANAAVEQPA